MTEQEKQAYKDEMLAKALAYGEEKLKEYKPTIPQEEYEGFRNEYANAFLSGVNASMEWLKEHTK